MRKFINMKSHSLFQSDYIQLQSVVSSITSWKLSVQAGPSQKKKKTPLGRKKENEMEINGRRPERWESIRRKQKRREKKEQRKEEKKKEEKKKKGRKEKMRRKRRKGKRWKRGEEEKGWKEFVQKEREEEE